MPVDVNQWRAAIASFRFPISTKQNILHEVQLFSIFLAIFKLCLFCCTFVAISVPVLPITMIVQIAANFSFYPNACFLRVFVHLYSHAKAVPYIPIELMKRFPVFFLRSCNRRTLKCLVFRYSYFYATCLICHTLHLQWTTYQTILRSGDIETNPGPEHSTFNFCSWNLNSICAHNFTRVSLIEAYNSVYNYDLIGIVETHLDSTVDESKLDLTGYSFLKSNHPNNVRRGGVGLYMKDSFPAKSRPDLATLPECIVCEVQLDKKKYFFVILYRSPRLSPGMGSQRIGWRPLLI